ncbi:MAG: hypothetical protein EYC62_07990 [Alphaproteobacteria bacterium]|nr:MAG: hypothetical protein EYC62_07990 [Alphaproteobacteria bacterium]
MMKLFTIFRRKNSQRGFLAAPVLFGMLASAAAITLAGSYVGIFDKLIDQQRNVQARNKLQQLASIIAESNLDQQGVMKVAPAMSATAGGRSMQDGDVPNPEWGGKLPTGFSANTKFGEVAYFAFIHMPRSTDNAPAGYYLSGAGGIPNPDEMSFAMILPGADGQIDTNKNDVMQGITRGDDIGIFKTVRDVNRDAYKNLIENAGNIPTCGITGTGRDRKLTNLQWNIDQKNWECVESTIPAFFLKSDSAAENIPTCPQGTALTLRLVHEGDAEHEYQELACVSTVAPRARSDFGLIFDENGAIASLIDGDMAAAAPCTNHIETFRWTGTQRICNGIPENVVLSTCSAGNWLAVALSRYTSCYPFNNTNLARNGGPGARTACNGGITPYYASGRTFCPEDAQAGGLRVCKAGFDVGFVSSMGGFGCYILNDPVLAGGFAEDAAVHYSTSDGCPVNNVMQARVDDRRLVQCINIFEALRFAMPANTCPPINGKRGSLTFIKDANPNPRFTCTAVD